MKAEQYVSEHSSAVHIEFLLMKAKLVFFNHSCCVVWVECYRKDVLCLEVQFPRHIHSPWIYIRCKPRARLSIKVKHPNNHIYMLGNLITIPGNCIVTCLHDVSRSANPSKAFQGMSPYRLGCYSYKKAPCNSLM
jgi:hypothetical protein